VLAARRGAKVFAFEPEAQNYALLCRNMTLNEVDGRAYCLALSDKVGLSTMYLTGQQAGGSCHSLGEKVGHDLQAREGIEQGAFGYTLDLVASELPRPDHVKIDVDGFEHRVIAGAKGILATAKSVLIEVNTNLPEHMQMVNDLLDMGFAFDQAQVDAAVRKEGPFKGCAEYVFRRVSAQERAFLTAVEAAKIKMTPFPHIVLTGVDLGVQVPADTEFKSLEKVRGTAGYKERRTAPVQTWLTSGRFRAALARKFAVASTGEEAFLLRDSHGYQIPPHTDTPAKAMTALFYLNDAEEGTSLYRPKKKGFKSTDGLHLPRKNFTKVSTVPFKAGTMVAFARTDESFHGVEPFTGKGFRDILCWTAKA
jgi:FkbM family methyltransferase